jgi:hypothetical protein
MDLKMTKQLSELLRAKRGVALLATCIVQTMNEKDPTFQDRFLERLSEAYHEVKDNWGGDVIQEIELLSWTREYLTGFSFIDGQGEPFLKDYEPKNS